MSVKVLAQGNSNIKNVVQLDHTHTNTILQYTTLHTIHTHYTTLHCTTLHYIHTHTHTHNDVPAKVRRLLILKTIIQW